LDARHCWPVENFFAGDLLFGLPLVSEAKVAFVLLHYLDNIHQICLTRPGGRVSTQSRIVSVSHLL
jgi:hypothetical protein